MFTNKTVFVLGAGASWHYGYPTGEGLVENVISWADRFSAYCVERLKSGDVEREVPDYVAEKPEYRNESRQEGWKKTREECQLLIDRLRTVRPLLIDHFLAWNESLRPIGKLMIAAAILECERIWTREKANQNRRAIYANNPVPPSPDDVKRLDIKKYRDDWYRFVVHKLAYGCGRSSDLLTNKVRFITFNYDASLEYHLFRALTAIDLFEQADVERFLGEDRTVHIYGSVHSGIPSDNDMIDEDAAKKLGDPFTSPFGSRKALLDRCWNAAQNLRTIEPHDKEQDEAALRRARQWIDEAAVLYILGYGFDASNNRRIGLDPSLRARQGPPFRSVMFTNFEDINSINKRASHLVFGTFDKFQGESVYGTPVGGHFIEKSVRTVYDALERDFAALETELIAATPV